MPKEKVVVWWSEWQRNNTLGACTKCLTDGVSAVAAAPSCSQFLSLRASSMEGA
jgi:hypothetical protein